MRYLLYAFLLLSAFYMTSKLFSGLFGGHLFHSAKNVSEKLAQSVVTPQKRPRRIVAIADLHGDGPAMKKVLQLMKLTDARGRWIAGNTVFVQTGDIVDRGPDTYEMYKSMMRLQKEAAAEGGEVVQLLGNHEVMNLQEDLRYVDPGDFESFGGRVQRQKDWSSSGWLGSWLRQQNICVVRGDTMFVHAGMTTKYIRSTDNQLISKLIDSNHRGNPLMEGDGPVWYRGYAERRVSKAVCNDLKKVLKHYGAKRMVSGHTPQLDTRRMLSSCGGRYIVADLGISKAYGGPLGGLELLLGTDGYQATAVYEDKTVIMAVDE